MALKALFRPPPSADQTGRYYGIDLIRGAAALAILFWHYQHFIALGMAAPGSRGAYPLYSVFWPLYEDGGAAVQLFWIISGFVFSAVYFGQAPSAGEFLRNRFARLYPLHFLTLIVISGLQLACQARFGQSLIYHANDFGHFVSNLAFVNGWLGLEKSFNGPIWSVSAEILIYALFWAVLPWLFRFGALIPLLLSGFGYALWLAGFNEALSLCCFDYFLGCAIYSFHRSVSPWLAGSLSMAALAAAAAIFALHKIGIAVLVMFIGTVTGIAWAEGIGWFRRAARSVRWIGDNTYGVYLWHIPVQLSIFLLVGDIPTVGRFAYSSAFLAGFLLVVILIARASFVWFEAPARRYLHSPR
jgi:peptidoglycan/LPS O-acetylase OafA/YrhL